MRIGLSLVKTTVVIFIFFTWTGISYCSDINNFLGRQQFLNESVSNIVTVKILRNRQMDAKLASPASASNLPEC